VVAEKREKCKR